MLTEALLLVVTESVFSHILQQSNVAEKVLSRLGRDQQKLAFQVALARAYTTFARNHPQWTLSLFDEHFLQNAAAPFLARCLPWREQPDPAELATAWVDQMRLGGGKRDQRISEATAAASDFLRCLRAELRARDEFQQDYDSIALDTVAEASMQNAELIKALRADLERTLNQAAKYQVTVQEAKGLVIGDNATVTNTFQTFFDSNYASLQEYYLPPDDVFERVRVNEFVGRAWLEGDLEQFLNTNDRGVWLLVGEAGIGKTSFLAHLVRERQYLHFFAEQAPGDANLARAIQSLAAQLISRFRLEPYNERGTLPQTLSSYPDFLSRVLRAASDKLGAGERIIVVVDALDEAGIVAGGNVLGLPRQLPHGVYVVASQRPQAVTLNIEPPPHRIDLRAAEQHNQNDIATYVRKIAHTSSIAVQRAARGYTIDNFVRTLAEKSAGNWMYLHYVVDEIRGGRCAPLDLASLPPGLAGYYAQYWGRWSKRSDWDSVCAPVLTTLAAAQEPISLTTLKRWGGIQVSDYELRRLLKQDWAAFVYEVNAKEPRYRPYHLSLREFLSGSLKAEEFVPEVEFLLEEFRERSQEAHVRIVADLQQRCKGDLHNAVPDRYVHHYLTTHLRKAGEQEVLFQLVEDWNWYNSQMRMDPSGAAFANDVMQAWEVAETINRKAVDQKEGEDDGVALDLGRELRYALTIASLKSYSQNLPVELLEALVLSRRWTLGHALAAARQIPKPLEQGLALVTLAVQLPPKEQREVLDEVVAIIGPVVVMGLGELYERSSVQAQLVCQLSQLGHFKEALSIARTIEDVFSRTSSLVEVALQIAIPEESQVIFDEALDVAYTSDDLSELSWTLAEVTRALAEGGRTQDALGIARTIVDDSVHVSALVDLTRRWSEAERHLVLDEALALARSIEDDSEQVQALVEVASELGEAEQREVIDEVLTRVYSIDRMSTKAAALAEVSRVIPITERGEVLNEALALAANVEDTYSRGLILSVVALELVELGDIQQALVVTHSIEPCRDQSRTLAKMSYRLAELGASEQALTIAHHIRDTMLRVRAIAQLALKVSETERDQLLDEAVSTARSIKDSSTQVISLVGLLPRVAMSERMLLLKETFSLLPKIDDAGERAETLAHLARLFLQQGYLEHALTLARAIENASLEVDVLVDIASELQAPLRKEILNEALALARIIPAEDVRARYFVQVALQLPPTEQQQILDEAFAAAYSIEDSLTRSRTLEIMARYMATSGDPRQALAIVRAIKVPATQASILTQIALRLPEHERRRIVDEAVAIAASIDNIYVRDAALVHLAPHLAALGLPTKALEIVRSFEASYYVCLGLAEVALNLPVGEQRQILDEALVIARTIETPFPQVTFFGQIASALVDLGDLEQALSLASSIDASSTRDKILAKIAIRSIELDEPEEALAVARTITDIVLRVKTLAQVALLIERSYPIKLYSLWQEMLHLLATRLRADLLKELEALSTVATILGGPRMAGEMYRAVLHTGTWWP